MVTVKSRAFSPAEVAEPQFWETPWFATILRNVVALLSVLLVLLLAVKPLLKLLGRKLEPAGAGEDEEAAEAGAPGDPAAAPPPLPVPEELAQQIDAARRIAREQPEDAVQALRRMLREPVAPTSQEAA